MEREVLQQLIADLAARQLFSTELISLALLSHSPADPFMRNLYEVQDELFCELRMMLWELPGTDPELLDKFDQLLHIHRINLLLVITCISPPAT